MLHVMPIVPLFLAGAIGVTWVAYNFPPTTITLTILLGQVAQHELAPLIGLTSESLSLGFAQLRLSDPFLLGIVVTLLIRLLGADRSLIRLSTKDGLFLSFLLVYLFFQM